MPYIISNLSLDIKNLYWHSNPFFNFAHKLFSMILLNYIPALLSIRFCTLISLFFLLGDEVWPLKKLFEVPLKEGNAWLIPDSKRLYRDLVTREFEDALLTLEVSPPSLLATIWPKYEVRDYGMMVLLSCPVLDLIEYHPPWSLVGSSGPISFTLSS